MCTVKQFGKTPCFAPPWPDLAGETPDQIIGLTKALTNDTTKEVGSEDKGEKKQSQSVYCYLDTYVKKWDEVI